MSFQGDIPSLSLGDVIQNLANNQKTGVLAIRGPRGKHHIVFETGEIVSYVDESFPPVDWFVEKGFVPAAAKQEILRRYSREEKTLGQVFEEMRLVDPETYRNLLRGFLKERLYEVLCLRQGTFAFRSRGLENMPDDRDARSLRMALNPTTLLMDAARRWDDWQKIRNVLPSDEAVLAPAGDPAELAQGASDDLVRHILRLADGKRTVGQVIAQAPSFAFEVGQTLARLVAEGKLQLSSGAPKAAGVSEEPPLEAIPRLEAALCEDPRNADVLAQLADLSEAAGRKREAAGYAKTLAALRIEAEDFSGAARHVERALSLEPADEEAWRALVRIHGLSGKKDALLGAGRELAARLRKLELASLARSRLEALVRLYPWDAELRIDLAEARIQAGERDGALRDLEAFGKKLHRRGLAEEADRTFSWLLEADPDRPGLRELLEGLRSGAAGLGAPRHGSVRTLVLLALLMTLCAQLCYELHVHGRLFQAAKAVFAEGLIEKGEYAEAMARIERVRKQYFLSLTSIYKAPALLEAIREGQEEAEKHGRTAGRESPGGASR